MPVDRTQPIEKLLEIGVALSGSYKLGELLNLILSKSREITCSDAGSVYLVDRSDSQPKLLFKAAQNASRPFVSFREFAIPLTDESLAGYVALTGESLNIPDAYFLPPEAPYHLNRNFDQDIGYRTRSVLVLPMRDRKGETIGVLQLLNRKKKPEFLLNPENVEEIVEPFSDWEERVVRSLASQAGISIERDRIQQEIEQLFEGFVKTSVEVIEARDPSTSGHSERVSQLVIRLCEQVNSATTGSLRRVHLSDRQLQVIQYAARLYDCGKLGVPEVILTKSKKLYPEQLALVKQRFDFVRRTLELECAQAKYQYAVERSGAGAGELTASLTQLDEELTASLARLDRYWQIVERANEPQQSSDERLGELEEVSEYTYQNLEGKPEPLIRDSELKQLRLTRGNLTARERSRMEAHVTYSYQFLQQIPWTKNLAKVPEIAYAHHEKLDGSGYPKGLRDKEIPIQAQVLAIADIYDALTAGDRPYKQGLPVREALAILRKEAQETKLNLELFELFEERQVFSILGHRLALDDVK
ncbi:GAF domain-containing protein [Oscillatoriales cyanobacterium LEGE 11467]|uniref:GAF domain-containing protein n=1 Tax=Zarconia navalis LEGE 11467 TaxID=1828826 RepID=A0A928VWR6_9CYAN|nr:HD family phosphohydrolase [Zarconia navalis]MBE9040964.1 GAF domain-containing protein [Zarconia navalis LEGE 11467]